MAWPNSTGHNLSSAPACHRIDGGRPLHLRLKGSRMDQAGGASSAGAIPDIPCPPLFPTQRSH
eukprot:scaffold14582_cov108-Isochrysis_galbana.AAC.4